MKWSPPWTGEPWTGEAKHGVSGGTVREWRRLVDGYDDPEALALRETVDRQ